MRRDPNGRSYPDPLRNPTAFRKWHSATTRELDALADLDLVTVDELAIINHAADVAAAARDRYAAAMATMATWTAVIHREATSRAAQLDEISALPETVDR